MTKKRLYLNTISDDFNSDSDVAAGPWCFSGKEEIWPEWRSYEFCTSFDDVKLRQTHGEATRWLAHQQIKKQATILNELHGLDYPLEFWHRLLINWMLHLVQGSWKLYNIIEQLIAKHGNDEFDVIITDIENLKPIQNTEEFVVNLFEKNVILWFFLSEIITELAPKNWSLYKTEYSEEIRPHPSRVPSKRPFLHFVPGLNHTSDKIFKALITLLNWRKRPIKKTDFIQPVAQPDFSFPETYLTVLNKLIIHFLPQSFTEKFIENDTLIRNRPRRTGALRLGFINFHDDNENLESAHALLSGEHVVSIQHGGCYGWASPFSLLAEVEYSLSGFITWGWKEHSEYEGQFQPLPIPMLSRHCHQGNNNSILLVGAAAYGFNPRFDLYPHPLKYLEDKKEILKYIHVNIRRNLFYRPYKVAQTFKDESLLVEHFPEISVHEGDFNDSVLACRLLVLDHASTSFHQALAWNVPTVVYWNENEWPLLDDKKYFLTCLKKAGIAFETPKELGEHINVIWEDVEGWWHSAEVQSARKEWINEYAQRSKFWWFHWLKFVLKGCF
ncbi:MAG: hypothetical protein HWE34_05980 [Methylocystaceae bacterium]|nr:hypothetical protein [Methylocystaceae bacterium]